MESITRNSTSEGNLPPQGVIFNVSSLYAYLQRIHDRLKRRGICYTFETILVVPILAKLCGLDKPYEIADWAQNRSEFLVEVLHLKRARLPHHGLTNIAQARRLFDVRPQQALALILGL